MAVVSAPVADLGMVAWAEGGCENFKGVPKIQGGAKLTNLVNSLKFFKLNQQSKQ